MEKYIYFNDIFQDYTKYSLKIPKNMYLKSGLYPIIDQGKEEIAGFSNQSTDIFNDVPVIIFGDHTRIFKYIDYPFFLGADGVKILKNISNLFLDKFLYYSLKNFKIPNTGYNRHFKWLKNFKIKYISLIEQKKIVNIIEKIEAFILQKKEQLNYLKKLNKSLFTRMFGDIKTNDKNWKIIKLEKYINIIGGYAFKNTDFKSNGIPLIRIGNINSGQFKSTNLVFIEENKKFEKFKVFPNDILISLTGTVGKDDYGNACILGDSYSEYYLNQRNAKIELTDKMNKNFFLEIMKIKEVKKKLTGISRGIRQANISNKDIYNLSLPLPPIELQNKFAERIEKIEKLKFEIEKSIEEAQKLYNSLISKYFDN